MTLLRVEGVSRHFGSLVAVDKVSLEVAPGELRAVIAGYLHRDDHAED